MITSTDRMNQAITPPCCMASMKPNLFCGASPPAAAKKSMSMRVVLFFGKTKTGWLSVELVDDAGARRPGRRVAGIVQRRVVTGVARHAVARRFVEHARAARAGHAARGDAALSADRHAHADRTLGLV